MSSSSTVLLNDPTKRSCRRWNGRKSMRKSFRELQTVSWTQSIWRTLNSATKTWFCFRSSLAVPKSKRWNWFGISWLTKESTKCFPIWRE
jgi:hypothetical protein